MKKVVGNKRIERKILETLKKVGKPVSVDLVAFNVGLTWHTARASLFKLAADGRVRALDTSKSWVFSLAKDESKKSG